jgi:hypothetical protein
MLKNTGTQMVVIKNPSTSQEDRKRVTCCILLLFLLALGLRLLYANVVFKQFAELSTAEQTSYKIGYLTPDSPGYLEPAADLMKGHIGQAISLYRPIGYPAFLALLRANRSATLYAQAILLSLIPICTFLLVRLLTESNLLGFAAGVASSISPTGIAIGSLVMSDALFASLFAVVFTTMVYGIVRHSLRWVVFSAIGSGFAILVKPILLFWPVVAVVVSALIVACQNESRNNSRRWLQIDKSRYTQMLVLFFVPIIFIVSMAGANYKENGTFTVSIIGKLTLREYLAVRTEEWGIAGHLPLQDAIKQNQNILRKRTRIQEQAFPFVPESIAIFKKYPIQTIKAFVMDAQENVVGGWDYFLYQLPFSQHQLAFSRISNLETRLRKIALLITFFAPFVGLVLVWIDPSPYLRRLVPMLFAMNMTFLYFVILSGITFWTGPRIIYPTEILEISTAAVLVAALVRALAPDWRWGYPIGARECPHALCGN